MHLVSTQSLGLRISLQKGPTALEKGLPHSKKYPNFYNNKCLKFLFKKKPHAISPTSKMASRKLDQ